MQHHPRNVFSEFPIITERETHERWWSAARNPSIRIERISRKRIRVQGDAVRSGRQRRTRGGVRRRRSRAPSPAACPGGNCGGSAGRGGEGGMLQNPNQPLTCLRTLLIKVNGIQYWCRGWKGGEAGAFQHLG